ncbi:uncharacterized protein LY79DRAFT_30925 [Colletotrichum navitas]|uniref:Uncharacterized protein n=1 Tax=Colletotrichum navitas TaxID=681940 RepID=A0AAD8V8Y7_9PEZI|nr:uncharacterized protein LY79DRAFT_30925 [Colletotrichum navitas]KAK1596778.1 hypothetical protein LY79DRAFT_30925 [Colletotrichum navitas]
MFALPLLDPSSFFSFFFFFFGKAAYFRSSGVCTGRDEGKGAMAGWPAGGVRNTRRYSQEERPCLYSSPHPVPLARFTAAARLFLLSLFNVLNRIIDVRYHPYTVPTLFLPRLWSLQLKMARRVVRLVHRPPGRPGRGSQGGEIPGKVKKTRKKRERERRKEEKRKRLEEPRKSETQPPSPLFPTVF